MGEGVCPLCGQVIPTKIEDDPMYDEACRLADEYSAKYEAEQQELIRLRAENACFRRMCSGAAVFTAEARGEEALRAKKGDT